MTPGAGESAVVVIGSHYGGNLAIWFRQKYPHLTVGAWGSSAPLLSIINHQLYKETAGASYRSFGGDACYNAIENGFSYMDQMVEDNKLDELSTIFNLCEDSYLRTERSISLFFSLIAESLADIVRLAT